MLTTHFIPYPLTYREQHTFSIHPGDCFDHALHVADVLQGRDDLPDSTTKPPTVRQAVIGTFGVNISL